MERSRQFSDLRQSRSAKKDTLTSSFSSRPPLKTNQSQFGQSSVSSFKSHYVCIDCVNRELSSDKRHRQHQLIITQQSRYRQLEQSRRLQENNLMESRERLKVEQRRRIADYNKGLIDSQQKERKGQMKEREEEWKRVKVSLAENARAADEEGQRRRHAKQTLRLEIQSQIQQKKQRKLREQLQERYPQPLPQDNSIDLHHLNKQKYRQQLQYQIRQNKQRKDREKRKQELGRTREQSFLNQLLEANQRNCEEREKRMRREVEVQGRARQEREEGVRRERQGRAEVERRETMIRREFEEKQVAEGQLLRNDRALRYRREIEAQMRANEQKRRRLRDAQKLDYTASTAEKEIERKLCDSCEKTYPKKYMTRIKKKK